MANTLFLITGPSGAGKSTLLRCALPQLKSPCVRIVTYTTRLPRAGENDGVDYHFVPPEDFAWLAEREHFLETNDTTDSGKGRTFYGSPRTETIKMLESASVVLELDINGTLNIPDHPDIVHSGVRVVKIAVTAPLPVLERRLTARGSETPQQIRNRLDRAMREQPLIAEIPFEVVNDQDDPHESALVLARFMLG